MGNDSAPLATPLMGGELFVLVKNGNGLKSKEFLRKADPYVKLRIGHTGISVRTRTVRGGGENPNFNQNFAFDILPQLENKLSLVVQVFSETLLKDKVIGETTISLTHLSKEKEKKSVESKRYDLSNGKSKVGSIELEICYEPKKAVPKQNVTTYTAKASGDHFAQQLMGAGIQGTTLSVQETIIDLTKQAFYLIETTILAHTCFLQVVCSLMQDSAPCQPQWGRFHHLTRHPASQKDRNRWLVEFPATLPRSRLPHLHQIRDLHSMACTLSHPFPIPSICMAWHPTYQTTHQERLRQTHPRIQWDRPLRMHQATRWVRLRQTLQSTPRDRPP